ncbi:MAG: DUF3299 domain-containing protein [Luteibaculaceae bacterium]
MPRLLILLLFCCFSQALQAQIPQRITWEELSDVRFTEEYSQEVDAYYWKPKFGKTPLALEGKRVLIRGFFIPFSEEEKLYVLSANPFAACFFCGAAGPETVVALRVKDKLPKRYNMDDVITFVGFLKLNPDDLYELNYILEDAKVWDDK